MVKDSAAAGHLQVYRLWLRILLLTGHLQVYRLLWLKFLPLTVIAVFFPPIVVASGYFGLCVTIITQFGEAVVK
jgi:hypothetical protein